MKFIYELMAVDVTVSLEAETGESVSDIEYEGYPGVVSGVSYQLEGSSGMYGSLIGTTTTPNDLAVAMASPEMQAYKPELIEGAELLGNAPANPQPDGSTF